MAKGEKITDSSFILMLLKRIQQHKSLLTCAIPRKMGNYTSAILEIQSDPNVIVLDQLNPSSGHDDLKKVRMLEIESTLKGVRVKMQCHLLHIDESEAIAKYHFAFPAHLWYQQQRESFRVQVSPDLNFQLKLHTQQSEWIDVKVVDMSHEGCGIEIDRHVKFDKGELIKHCDLCLPDGKHIYCKMIVRYVSHDDHQNLTHLGVKILDFEGLGKRDYLKAIQEAQREMVRRQSRLIEHDHSARQKL